VKSGGQFEPIWVTSRDNSPSNIKHHNIASFRTGLDIKIFVNLLDKLKKKEK
jgi:hypothetical protein